MHYSSRWFFLPFRWVLFSAKLSSSGAPHSTFVDLYIPSNPFHSLANNVVPAVVLFSIFIGIALIGVERKQVVLDVLVVAVSALSQATRFVVGLTPFGIFAISAVAAGTLHFCAGGAHSDLPDDLCSRGADDRFLDPAWTGCRPDNHPVFSKRWARQAQGGKNDKR